jgi:hypothetical protein
LEKAEKKHKKQMETTEGSTESPSYFGWKCSKNE